jgi:hypothetical protein
MLAIMSPPLASKDKNKRPQKTSTIRAEKKGLDVGVATVLAAIIGTAGVVVGRIYPSSSVSSNRPDPIGSHSSSGSSTITPPPKIKATEISFSDPRPGANVKECPAKVDGKGNIPRGFSLLIAVTPDIRGRPAQFWIESVGVISGTNTWVAKYPTSINTEMANGVEARLYAVLVPTPWEKYIATIRAIKRENDFYATKLPPASLVTSASVLVTRIPGKGQC